tara:strand:- start:1783 stop:3201 length:1419 start_codon:yes stop_codon:yes gene_type:complete
MSLRTLLISIVVAGVLAGLVLISRGLEGTSGSEVLKSRTLGIDAVSVVEIELQRSGSEREVARRDAGGVDQWRLYLDGEEDDGRGWSGDPVRVRSVLRALATSSIAVDDEEKIGGVYGTLMLKDQDSSSTEIRFGDSAAGGFVHAEIVDRGKDGIATHRWFGRIERSLRDSMFADGMNAWRSLDLFEMTMTELTQARFQAGNDEAEIRRDSSGWRVLPWDVAADPEVVGGMLGLTLGLRAERFYDGWVYTDDLTGLGDPLAEISLLTRSDTGAGTMIQIGSGVDSTGKEVFARYTLDDGRSYVIAVLTEGLNRLTASPLAYVKRSIGGVARADIARVTIQGADGKDRFEVRSSLGSWVRISKGNEVAATPSESKAIDRLLSILSSEQAQRVYDGVEGRGEGFAEIGGVELTARDGTAERYEVAIVPTSEGMRLHISRSFDNETGLVWVYASPEAAGSGAWIAAVGSGPGGTD